MFNLAPLEAIDYLVIGHLCRDLGPAGPHLGGTVAYSALTARALGLRVGIVTAWGGEVPLGPLQHIPIANYPADHSTTFENIYHNGVRAQVIHEVAPNLDYYMIPEPWRQAGIVHLGLSLIHISEPTRLLSISYAVFCLKTKNKNKKKASSPN